jgi:hypothetical protein
MAFEPSKRTRRNSWKAAEKLLGPGVQIREVGFGRAQGRWTTTTIALLSIFGGAFMIALLSGVVLIPGALLVIVIVNSAWPLRTVVVANQGVALLQRSIWTGRPNKVLALLPHDPLAAPFAEDPRRRAIGADIVRFSEKELQRLTVALPAPATALS